MAGLALMLAGQARAQTFTTLYSFSADIYPTYTNSNGALPAAGLFLSGDTLYGAAQYGGIDGTGTVFALNTDDMSFTNLHTLTYSDASDPVTALILSDGILYGTAPFGGSGRDGAVFSVQINGGPYAAVHNFTPFSGSGGTFGTNGDGGFCYGALILSGNTLYGTAFDGGSLGQGTVFAVNTDSTDFRNLHSFTGDSNGACPYAGLILSGDTLYGTTSSGFIPTEQSGFGTVFAINTNGSDFTTLYSFTNGSDGSQPFGGLILSGSALYGTAYAGGLSGFGTVFALNTNGSNFTTLYSFTNGSDGSMPWAGLILSGNTLYGTANRGGDAGNGTVFSVNTNGSNFTTLHGFTTAISDGISAYPSYTNSDGYYPLDQLILSSNTLYGTAQNGGVFGSGTIFSISLPSVGAPQLAITAAGTNVILTWPTNDAGFTLQSATNLGSSAVWTTNSPAPVLISGQFTVTNSVTGSQMFYRLSQ